MTKKTIMINNFLFFPFYKKMKPKLVKLIYDKLHSKISRTNINWLLATKLDSETN